jgi:hypothetical protein
MEMEVVGANGVRQVITTTGTFYNGPTLSRSSITMRTDLFEPNTTTPGTFRRAEHQPRFEKTRYRSRGNEHDLCKQR